MSEILASDEPFKLCWIFDLDGTLLDSIKVYAEIFTQTVPNHYGKPLQQDHRIELEGQMLQMFSGTFSKWQFVKIFWKYAKKLELSLRDKFGMFRYIKKEIHTGLMGVSLLPGVMDALHFLKEKGDQVAINTSSSRKYVDLKLAGKEEFLEFFNGNIITKSDVEHRKPDPESVVKASRNSNLPLSSCIMVGDMPSDIQAGQNTGVVSIAVLCGVLTEKDIEMMRLSPDFIFQNVVEAVAHRKEMIKFISRRKREKT